MKSGRLVKARASKEVRHLELSSMAQDEEHTVQEGYCVMKCVQLCRKHSTVRIPLSSGDSPVMAFGSGSSTTYTIKFLSLDVKDPAAAKSCSVFRCLPARGQAAI